MKLFTMFSITFIFYYILGCLFNINLGVHKAGEYMKSYMTPGKNNTPALEWGAQTKA